VLVAQIKLVHLAGYIEWDMTRGYNVRVMNIADDHKPFSHRAPPFTSRLSGCSNSGRRRRAGRCLHAGVATHEPMISRFFGQFDGQLRRTPWQAIRLRSAACADSPGPARPAARRPRPRFLQALAQLVEEARRDPVVGPAVVQVNDYGSIGKVVAIGSVHGDVSF